jgi:hypothetical protein
MSKKWIRILILERVMKSWITKLEARSDFTPEEH